ncbi:ParB/RepB/Spo0J family partition protein [Candidatus Parcubacteria bacterium]|nr:ParB/RepB/Spo0J family partition protein [Candidatus Parcubacteria bacterium]
MNRMLMRSISEVRLKDIIVSKANTRAHYDTEALDGLVESTSAVGQIYPVVLRPINDTKYELVIGTRRLRAAEMRRLERIPAFIIDKDVDDKDMVILALSENLHRQDLTPFEEAKAILRLCKDFNMEPKQVAKRIGKPVNFVTGRLKILALPEKVQTMLCEDHGLNFSHVEVLGALKKPRDQIRYAKMAVKGKFTREDLTTVVHEKFGPQPGRKPGAYGHYLRTPQRMALKLKRINSFLKQRIPEMLEPGQSGIASIIRELAMIRKTINELLGNETKK